MKIRLSLILTQGFSVLFGLAVGSPAFGFDLSLIKNVTQRAYSQAEQAITINRANPYNIFIATNGRGYYDQTYLVFARSINGGYTWRRGTFANGSDGLPAACCEPSLTSDRFGNLYIAYLKTFSREVIVGRSTDGGRHWTQLANLGSGEQPTIVAGPGTAPREQSIWVTWTHYRDDGIGQLLAAGATATGRGQLGSFLTKIVPYTLDPPYKVGGFGDIAIGPGGKVVVAHQDINSGEGPDAIRVNTYYPSNCSGEFGSTITATLMDPNNVVIGAWHHIPAQPIRSVYAAARLAWSLKTNRLFMVYTDADSADSNDTNIELIYSDDDGATWSLPLRLNDDNTNRSQFLPRIALDSTTGNLAIVWYDARNDDGSGADRQRDFIPNGEAELWGTVSFDGGQSFVRNFKISAGMSSAPLAATVAPPD
ncbi:MAG TPA: hypothetical protein VES89_11975, partial [Candidatus Competibacteraceae bacterium]|nr:hypothetical protein [Candidatus Competibacteraceae bacterium]